jgi:hypothetical protein
VIISQVLLEGIVNQEDRVIWPDSFRRDPRFGFIKELHKDMDAFGGNYWSPEMIGVFTWLVMCILGMTMIQYCNGSGVGVPFLL